MKAIWNKETVAEATPEELIRIEGNWYFPAESIKKDFFKDSDRRTTCFWIGEASYYDVTVDGQTSEFGAWYYPQPIVGSIEKVGKDFTNYVAFWNGIEVVESH
ncbi:MAG: hypothetical protein JWM00_319 [Candidatus Saccharibacteria bacterium]|nr:hypothetical protein [Candidatus Saccharibacteria bacterium]